MNEEKIVPTPVSSSQTEQEKANKKKITLMKSMSFVLQFGFIIVLPLVLFGSAGKWASVHYNNQIFLFLSLILALLTSTVWFYKRISDLYKDFID